MGDKINLFEMGRMGQEPLGIKERKLGGSVLLNRAESIFTILNIIPLLYTRFQFHIEIESHMSLAGCFELSIEAGDWLYSIHTHTHTLYRRAFWYIIAVKKN